MAKRSLTTRARCRRRTRFQRMRGRRGVNYKSRRDAVAAAPRSTASYVASRRRRRPPSTPSRRRLLETWVSRLPHKRRAPRRACENVSLTTGTRARRRTQFQRVRRVPTAEDAVGANAVARRVSSAAAKLWPRSSSTRRGPLRRRPRADRRTRGASGSPEAASRRLAGTRTPYDRRRAARRVRRHRDVISLSHNSAH